MFKTFVPAIVLTSALCIPALTYAQQTSDSLTRAAVKADLVQMEQAGYNPEGDRTSYPAQTQAAEQRVEMNRGDMATSYGTSYGSPTNGSSATGTRVPMAQPDGGRSIYFGQ